MTFIDRANYYAKAVVGGAGAIVAFGAIVVGITSDGQLDGGELATLLTAGITLIATVIGIIKKRNIDPPTGVQ